MTPKTKKKKAPVYLWTGPGWGKTTSALGCALRALGHGFSVVVIQFMKGRREIIGEYKARKLLGPKFEIYQFGRTGWVNLKKPSLKDKKLAREGFAQAKKSAKRAPFLLILDEINLAVASGLLDEQQVIRFLNNVPSKTHVYLTGRWATPRLIERADFVNEIIPVKGPKKLKGEKGIDY